MKTTRLETPSKEDDGGGGGGGLHEERAKKTTIGFQNHLDLSLGISSNGFQGKITNTDGKGGGSSLSGLGSGLVLNQRHVGLGGSKRWFYETGNGFVHPWSLAARQEKAALEQTHPKANPSSTISRAAHPPPRSPPVVGWPPVRTFRRNLMSTHPPKTEMEAEKDAKKAKTSEGDGPINTVEVKSTMFVKVNMQGYAIGRKIDLKAHDSYESLSRTLQRMFTNFLSVNYTNNSEQDELEEMVTSDYILLYEDHEGDRMLVGDVPWEMFIASVKRLYIANGTGGTSVDRRVAEQQL